MKRETDASVTLQGGTMLIAVFLTIAVATAGQEPASPQKLFEAGKYQEAIDNVKARDDAPRDQVYCAPSPPGSSIRTTMPNRRSALWPEPMKAAIGGRSATPGTR